MNGGLNLFLSLLLMTASLLSPATALAGPCDKMSGAARNVARRVMNKARAYACCKDTLANCLKKKTVCRLVRRLADDACRRATFGESSRTILDALKKRSATMQDKTAAPKVKLDPRFCVGPSEPRVLVVEYACFRCPYCARVTPGLHGLIKKGRLKGKVRLCMRPFPLKNHEGSVPAALYSVAAARMGRFWPFAEKLFAVFYSYSPKKLSQYAKAVGLDPLKMKKLARKKGSRLYLIGSKKEGYRNKVRATPTFFINGKRYRLSPRLPVLLDLVEEELDRVEGRTYIKKKGS